MRNTLGSIIGFLNLDRRKKNQVNQYVVYGENSRFSNHLKLLIVASAALEIPPKGWGAVEQIIHETIPLYESMGFQVHLLNSLWTSRWEALQREHFDVILIHADSLVGRVAECWPQIPKVVVTHYGYAGFPNQWHHGYESIIREIAACDAVISLSPKIYEVLCTRINREKVFLSPNGSSFTPNIIKRASSSPKYLILGKVEKRKRQFEVANFAAKNGIALECIGPIADKRILRKVRKNPNLQSIFVGSKSREEIQSMLSNYKGLILFSDGEADALVLYEAQLAGIPIIVSPEALGSQNPDLPWVFVIEDLSELKSIDVQIEKLSIKKDDIIEYAREHYSWVRRNKVLVNLIVELSSRK